MKIVSLLDADQRRQETDISARLAQELALVAQELARLRERVNKLEEGVHPETSG